MSSRSPLPLGAPTAGFANSVDWLADLVNDTIHHVSAAVAQLGSGVARLGSGAGVSGAPAAGEPFVARTSATVVFTDLSGFSDWSLRAGDEQVVRLLREVAVHTEPVLRHHGRIVKRLGDGVMAVFADPEAATDAAMRCRDVVAEHIEPRYGLRIRAGVHTGRPYRVGDDYVGQDVNLAARIADHAEADEILVSDATRRHLDDGVVLDEAIPMHVKGVPEGTVAYRATTHVPDLAVCGTQK